MMSNRVQLQPIQVGVFLYLRRGGTLSDICRQLEWYKQDGRPDVVRLQRRLGAGGNKQMNRATAVSIVRAIGGDPWEYDL